MGGSFEAAGFLFVGMVVTGCGLCGQWLTRVDGEKWLLNLKNNDEQ